MLTYLLCSYYYYYYYYSLLPFFFFTIILSYYSTSLAVFAILLFPYPPCSVPIPCPFCSVPIPCPFYSVPVPFCTRTRSVSPPPYMSCLTTESEKKELDADRLAGQGRDCRRLRSPPRVGTGREIGDSTRSESCQSINAASQSGNARSLGVVSLHTWVISQ